jgi:ribonuclease HII
MVMACVVLDTRGAAALTRGNVRDSKQVAGPNAKKERAALADRVRKVALHIEIQVVDVADIDRRVTRGELNVLEREIADGMITRAPKVDRIVADGSILFGALRTRHPHLEAKNNGEAAHAAVAAASIIAKHRRDQIFSCIARRYEPLFGKIIGGGYGNSHTRAFLSAYARRYRKLPPEARRSWPYPYLIDVFGPDYHPYADCPGEQVGQITLFSPPPTGSRPESPREIL